MLPRVIICRENMILKVNCEERFNFGLLFDNEPLLSLRKKNAGKWLTFKACRSFGTDKTHNSLIQLLMFDSRQNA